MRKELNLKMNLKANKTHNMPVGYIEVTKGNYRIRTEPKSTSEPIAIAERDVRYPYMGVMKHGWCQVLVAGKLGWLYKQAGNIVEVEGKYLTAKAGNKWSVRSAPDGKADVLGTVTGGEKLFDQGQTKNNYRLVIFDNQNGWIHNRAIVKE